MSSSVNDFGVIGTANQVLVVNSGGTALNYGAVNVASSSAVTGSLPVANGGTGDSSLTAYAVLCGGTTSTGAVQSIASVGTTGQVLTSNGAGALPTFQAAGGGSSVWTKISTTTVSSAQANVTFTSLSNTYSYYVLQFWNVAPVNNSVAFNLTYSLNNFTSTQANAYYVSASTNTSNSPTSVTNVVQSNSGATLTPLVQNASGYPVSNTIPSLTGVLTIQSPNQSALPASFIWQVGSPAGNSSYMTYSSGWMSTQSDFNVNAIRLLFGSGNISTGTFILYG